MEYADAVWGAMCTKTAINMLDRIQLRFCRRIMRLPWQAAGEFLRQELGMESMQQRVDSAALRFFGHLASLDKNARLAGFLFRRRCDSVDDGRAKHSWCRHAKDLLTRMRFPAVWTARAVPEKWHEMVQKRLREGSEADSAQKLVEMSSLSVFREMGRTETDGWLDRALFHKGAAIRLRLRCGQAPIMQSVGASAKIPAAERKCRICKQGQVEDAKHFVSDCPHYADERKECLRRITVLVAGTGASRMARAVTSCDPALFLSDRMLKELPPDKARAVDSVVCDYLLRAWRKRADLWKLECQPGTEWRLR
jgi:hypothetical protein